MHGGLGDDPQPALAAQHHLAHAGSCRRARHRAGHQHPRRSGHPNGASQVGHVAVTVGLHARRARGHPPTERGVGEAVREVAEGPAALVQLLLQVRPQHAGLDPRQARVVVDLQQAVEPAQVDGDDGARLARRSLEAARDVRAPAEGDENGVGVHARLQHRGHGVLVLRPDHGVGDPADVAAAVAHQVTQALAARVDDPIEGIGRDPVAPRGSLQLRSQIRRQRRLGNAELLEGHGPGGRPLDVDLEMAPDERAQGRLVPMRERNALISPTPPLHPW